MNIQTDDEIDEQRTIYFMIPRYELIAHEMRCIYKEFRRRREDWKVEYSGNLNINFIDVSDAVLTPEEANFVRSIKSKHEKWKKSKPSTVSVIRKSEESSDYSTSKEFKKLFEDLEESATSEDEDVQYNTNPYKSLPDVLQDSRKIDMKYHGSSEEDQEPCSSQQTTDLEERFKKLRETEDCSDVVIADNSEETCRAYKTERNSRKKKKKSRKQRSKRVEMELENEELRELIPHEQGYFELRRARGRVRSKMLEKSRNQNSNYIEFLTLNEILVERGIPADTVICCILCRLLVLNTVREEFFMCPCDCTDKFVHSKCALLYQSEMVRQKCSDCNKFYTDRILCRSRAPSLSKKNARYIAVYQQNLSTIASFASIVELFGKINSKSWTPQS
ncbi:hypothetical protein GCK72_018114 [Caenorhabditis remanei]|uniref:Uncharacterized protein n=1 Tax=Caenorhabditis remanei TaxID=31234 RepID=A0A6A5G980_CAERE|nr:hypothetical protein GCK72_018114 [Caenorhabditis remanei]KAF1751560.1 hypothetical protein GCK72_018114 [Caenorhabditis remanei]